MIHSALRWFDYGVRLFPKWVDGLCSKSMIYFQLGQDYATQALESI